MPRSSSSRENSGIFNLFAAGIYIFQGAEGCGRKCPLAADGAEWEAFLRLFVKLGLVAGYLDL